MVLIQTSLLYDRITDEFYIRDQEDEDLIQRCHSHATMDMYLPRSSFILMNQYTFRRVYQRSAA